MTSVGRYVVTVFPAPADRRNASASNANRVIAGESAADRFAQRTGDTKLQVLLKTIGDQNEVELEFKEVVAAPVQVRRTLVHGFADDRLAAGSRHNRRHSTFR